MFFKIILKSSVHIINTIMLFQSVLGSRYSDDMHQVFSRFGNIVRMAEGGIHTNTFKYG